MARPYKGYRAARAIYGHDRTPDVHRASRYNVSRTPVITATLVADAALAVTLTATAAVPDGSAVVLSVDWENDGSFVALAAPADFEHTYGAAGAKIVVVKAVAADGFTATATLNVTAAD